MDLVPLLPTGLLATAVNADGHREMLGLQVTSAEDGAGWLGFFRDLCARGLSGGALVTSDVPLGDQGPFGMSAAALAEGAHHARGVWHQALSRGHEHRTVRAGFDTNSGWRKQLRRHVASHRGVVYVTADSLQ